MNQLFFGTNNSEILKLWYAGMLKKRGIDTRERRKIDERLNRKRRGMSQMSKGALRRTTHDLRVVAVFGDPNCD